MQDKTVSFTATVTNSQAQALAQFLKRLVSARCARKPSMMKRRISWSTLARRSATPLRVLVITLVNSQRRLYF